MLRSQATKPSREVLVPVDERSSKSRHKHSSGHEHSHKSREDKGKVKAKNDNGSQKSMGSSEFSDLKRVRETGAKDMAGLREQIMENVNLAFPIYYAEANPSLSELPSLHIIVLIKPRERGNMDPYRAEVTWGPKHKTFLAAIPSFSARDALEYLLELSALVVGQLRHERKWRPSNMALDGLWEVTDAGHVATLPREVVEQEVVEEEGKVEEEEEDDEVTNIEA